MEFNQYRFDKIEDYLHHRDPYLLVDNVESIENESITTGATVSEDYFFIKGHFPGAPILPGAMMQEMTTQSAGILIAANFNPMKEYNTHDPMFNEYALGVLVKIKGARYKGFARPGDLLNIKVQISQRLGQIFDFKAKISVAGKTIMNNEFQLANILSSTLTGSA